MSSVMMQQTDYSVQTSLFVPMLRKTNLGSEFFLHTFKKIFILLVNHLDRIKVMTAFFKYSNPPKNALPIIDNISEIVFLILIDK